ncbi:MAG: hypothetical protein WKF87_09510 [Chryseolinea sp.]
MKTGLLVAIIFLTFAGFRVSTQTPAVAFNSKTIQMKQYSLLVRVPITYSTEQAKEVGPEWEGLIEKWKTERVYVLSFAFPGEGFTVSGPEKVVKKEYTLSGALRVVSNIVVQAETIEQAIEHAKECPILVHGGSVEVREIPNPLIPK